MSELPELVQALLDPKVYPEPPPRVELVQTQISYVFLAGDYVMGGKGETIECAVKMRRLPQDAMMDVLLKQNKVTPEMVVQVAAIIADFHRKAATSGEITRLGGINAVIQKPS